MSERDKKKIFESINKVEMENSRNKEYSKD